MGWQGELNIGPIKAIYDSMADYVFQDFSDNYNQFLRDGHAVLESPIEVLLQMGIAAYCRLHNISVLHSSFDSMETLEEFAGYQMGNLAIMLDPQYEIANRRVDFRILTLATKIDENKKETLVKSVIAVECDGAKFHHGDPKKAAEDKKRDRDLAEHFDVILRFTGSEINQNPFVCAQQILKICEGRLR